MADHTVGNREEWTAARDDLLVREKELTRLSDELAAQRRALPWVPVDKDYEFETDAGTKTLAELFDGRSQLLIYHFMFGQRYETGCPTCSAMADGFDGFIVHMNARDVTMICVSRAPLEKLQAYKRRMGWGFDWASSAGSDFNRDFGFAHTDEEVEAFMANGVPPILEDMGRATGAGAAGYATEEPGVNVFALDDGIVHQTYDGHARGVEFLMGFYGALDRVPKGRDEEGESEFWIRRHDEYGA